MKNDSLPRRLNDLRAVHPNVVVETENIMLDGELAVFKASVVIPDGGSSTGHGSATPADGVSYVELAENRALERALNGLEPVLDDRARERSPDAIRTPHQDAEQSSFRSSKDSQELEVQRGSGQIDADAVSYSWSAFWEWAKQHGYHSKEEIENAVGQSVTRMRPAEIRALVLQTRK